MKAMIVVLPGDGIGPEVTQQAQRVLEAIGESRGHGFEFRTAPFGGNAIETHGEPFPYSTQEICKEADAIMLGAIGGPQWSGADMKERPEQGLLQLRRDLELFANLRPVKIHPALMGASPVKEDRLKNVDLMIVRELVSGIYFGEKSLEADQAKDVCQYHAYEIERIVAVACEWAKKRRGHLTMVHKSNVLATSKLWESVTNKVLEDYPEVTLHTELVDAFAMKLIDAPSSFDVVVTENMFGDIVTDEAGVLAGSLGMLPSASIGPGNKGLYEPIHGSAPDIMGKGIANPYGAILSAAMLLEHTLDLPMEACTIEHAVHNAIEAGARTPDIASPGVKAVSTQEAGDAVLAAIGHCEQRAFG